MRKKLLLFMLFIVIIFSFKILETLCNYNRLKIYTHCAEARRILGKPAYTNTYEKDYFVDIYSFSFNKYALTYSKKDSLLVSKWKEN